MSHTEYSAQFVQYSSVFLGLEEAPLAVRSLAGCVALDTGEIYLAPALPKSALVLPSEGATYSMCRY
jgi:hypothetical protein